MLVRKLVLRGYDVVVLARNTEEVAQKLPSAVRVVQGDISDPLACRNAVEGVDKVRRKIQTPYSHACECDWVMNPLKSLLWYSQGEDHFL